MSERSEAAGRSKVARVLERYDLDGDGDRLVEEWTAPESERSSLRELAKWLNRRALESAMESAGVDPIDGDVDNVYELLTEEDVSSGTRVEARNRLRNEGVDVDRLESDFVSRQAVHTYLRNYREVSYEPPEKSATDRIADRRETVQRLRNRLVAVTERILQELDEADVLTVGDINVRVSVRVRCPDCNSEYGVLDLLEEEGCEC